MKNDHATLIHKLQEMPENLALEKVKQLGISLEIFRKNFNDLFEHLQLHNNVEIGVYLIEVENRNLLREVQIEITRHLHNYLASAQSLIDHTRILYTSLYHPQGLFPEYDSEIKSRFHSNLLTSFIKDFRNYVQHKKMPNLSSNFSFGINQPIEMKMTISINDLNNYSSWKSASKLYISKFEQEINIFDIINEYNNLIEDFHKWLSHHQKEIHKSDIEKVNTLKEEIRNSEIGNLINVALLYSKTKEEFEESIQNLIPKEILEKLNSSNDKNVKLLILENLFNSNNYWDRKYFKRLNQIY